MAHSVRRHPGQSPHRALMERSGSLRGVSSAAGPLAGECTGPTQRAARGRPPRAQRARMPDFGSRSL